jgi:hypothetical protein
MPQTKRLSMLDAKTSRELHCISPDVGCKADDWDLWSDVVKLGDDVSSSADRK